MTGDFESAYAIIELKGSLFIIIINNDEQRADIKSCPNLQVNSGALLKCIPKGCIDSVYPRNLDVYS